MKKFIKKILSFIFLLFLFVEILGDNLFISKLGNEAIILADVIVKGIPVEKIIIPSKGIIVQFKINKIYKGKIEPNKVISLFYVSDKYIDYKEEWVLFLKRLSSNSAFEVIRDFSLNQKDGKSKLIALEKIYQIELIPDLDIRIDAFLNYCLNGIKEEDFWTKWHCINEINYLIEKEINYITKVRLDKIKNSYENLYNSDIKKELLKIIIIVKQNFEEIEKKKNSLKFNKNTIYDVWKTSEDINVKIESLQKIVLYHPNLIEKTLIEGFDDPSPNIRALVSFYAGIYGSPKIIPYLIKTLNKDTYLRIKKNCIISLAKLQAREAIDEIKPYIEISYTSEIAINAIKKLEELPKSKFD